VFRAPFPYGSFGQVGAGLRRTIAYLRTSWKWSLALSGQEMELAEGIEPPTL